MQELLYAITTISQSHQGTKLRTKLEIGASAQMLASQITPLRLLKSFLAIDSGAELSPVVLSHIRASLVSFQSKTKISFSSVGGEEGAGVGFVTLLLREY